MKTRHIVGVERGFGPRHAFNAQEGTEAVPSELPSPPYEGENYGGKALRWVADQVRQGVLPDEALEEIKRDPTSARALAAYAGAALSAGTLLSGGEGVPRGEKLPALRTTIKTSIGDLPITDPTDSVTNTLKSHTSVPAGARIEYPNINEISGGKTRQPRVDEITAQMGGDNGHISRLLVDSKNNVIEGAHRLEALRNLGATEVPVVKLFGAEDFIPDVGAVKKVIKQSGVEHDDQVNQIVSHAGEALLDENGDVSALRDYDAPHGFEEPWNAAVNEIERQHGR